MITKPLIALGFLLGVILVWLSFVILTFANGDESVTDFAHFLAYSGASIATLVAFVGGLASTNLDGYERAGLLAAAGLMFLALILIALPFAL
ncbi:MAG: hypothetical protein ACE5QW_08050 [Thermoplasmata archaeon]